MMLTRTIGAINRMPVWKHQVRFGDDAIQVPNFDRWLYVKLHQLRRMGEAERRFLSTHVKPGMTVVDIGANIGLYSLFLAGLVGKDGQVWAFEPDPILFETAVTNCRQNGKEHIIHLHNLALGSRSGPARLYRSSFNSGDNRLSASTAGQESVLVEMAPLDTLLCQTKIDLIKIDVQGWEAEVLRGMEKTLQTNRDLTIYFEYWPEGLRKAGDEPQAPIDILRRYGFRVFFPDTGEVLSPQQSESLANRYSGRHFVNLVAKRV